MTCEEAGLKIQALSDNELADKDIQPVIEHIQSCYHCRQDYIDTLRLHRQLQGARLPEPEKEWFQKLNASVSRKAAIGIGQIFFFVSYLALAAYALFSFFFQSGTDILLKIIVSGSILGLLILFGVTIRDRLYEKKHDKYEGVEK